MQLSEHTSHTAIHCVQIQPSLEWKQLQSEKQCKQIGLLRARVSINSDIKLKADEAEDRK